MDLTLRDGMHAVSHQMTAAQMADLARKLDNCGVPFIEFGHGNGLGGSSYQYGFAAAEDHEYMEAVSGVVQNAALCAITLPGIGTRHHLELAKRYGVSIAKFATQITEADIAEQHIKMAKSLALKPVGGITCASMISVEETVRQAGLMASYGAEIVYLYDGGGYLLPEQVKERIGAMVKALNVPIGFHAHNNLQLAVANSLAAIEAGAEYLDTSVKGLGAGAGNCPTEVIVAVCDRLGYETGIDLFKVMDIAENEVKQLMVRPMELDSDRIMLGYAGCYSSFLLFAQRAGKQFGIDPRLIIKEVGRRQCTEGQENLCLEVAYDLAQKNISPDTTGG